MANFALNYSFSRNLNIPLDEDAVKSTYAEVLSYVQTKSKCYAGQLFSVVEDGDNNGLYVALTTGPECVIIKLATQSALEAVAESAGKIDKIQLNGTELEINDKTVNIDLSTYATTDSVTEAINGLSEVYAPKGEFEVLQGKVEEITSVGGEPNVPSDWNETNEESDSFIKNKPDLTVYAVATAVTEDIAEAIETAKGYTDDEVAKVDAKVDTLIGEDPEKSVRAIAAEEVAKVVANADADFDTLKEISDWILNDTTGAANMANDIAALKQEDINLDGRLDELEGLKHNHTNKETLDGITDEKVASWDAAEQNAKDYADGLAVNYDVAGAAASAETAAKSHAEAKASEAQSAAEAKAAELAGAAESAAKSHAETKASEAQAAAEAKAAELAGAAESAAKSHAETKASEAAIAAKSYADGLAVNYDAAGSAAAAESAAKLYAEGLAVNYDAAGAAATAEQNAKTYTNQEIGKLSDIYDVKGAAAAAESAAKLYAEGLAVNYDAAGAAATAEQNAKDYADSLAVNYDAAGAAVSASNIALENAKIYTNEEIAKLSEVYDAKGDAATAEQNAKSHAETKASEAQAAAEAKAAELAGAAEQNAKDYADQIKTNINTTLEEIYATKSYVDDVLVDLEGGNINLGGYAKLEDVASAKTEAIDAAKGYADGLNNAMDERVKVLEGIDHSGLVATAIASVVAEAPEDFDTLKEVADWIANDKEGAAALQIKVGELESNKADKTYVDGLNNTMDERVKVLEGIDHEAYVGADTELETALKEYTNAEIAKLSEVYDAKGDAATAEQNAKDYADSLATNYDAAGSAAAAETAAKAYADGLVENIKPYEGGVATSIEMGENEAYVVDVKVSDNDKNFLNVNNSNELEVSGITLDAAVTSKEITIEGGQWATAVKTVFTGGTVPAGTTWESFLEAMLCVEKFVGSVNTSRSFTVSCGNINPGLDKSGTVEVGTKVTLGATTANATTASQSLTVSAFTYGYKIGEDGERTTATAYTETLTPTKTKADDTLKITFTGFTTSVDGETVVETKDGNGSIAKVEMYAMAGTNKVVVAQTGDTYAASTAVTADTIYISTNLKNFYKSDKITPNTYSVTYPATSKTATDTTEYTVTGKYKYFIGDVVDYSADYWDTDRSEVVRGLATTGWTNGSETISSVSHTFKEGTKQQTVVLPAAYTSVTGKDVNNGDVAFNLVKTFDFTNAQGYVTSYKVFVAPALDGLGADSKITITMK